MDSTSTHTVSHTYGEVMCYKQGVVAYTVDQGNFSQLLWWQKLKFRAFPDLRHCYFAMYSVQSKYENILTCIAMGYFKSSISDKNTFSTIV